LLKNKDSAHIITDKEWELYETCSQFLSVFDHATKLLSASCYPSIHNVFYFLMIKIYFALKINHIKVIPILNDFSIINDFFDIKIKDKNFKTIVNKAKEILNK
jgi:hypothetical protein